MGFFEKIKQGLKSTKANMMKKIEETFSVFRQVDEELFEELEEILIMNDVGVKTATDICNKLRSETKKKNLKDSEDVKACLKEIITEILVGDNDLNLENKPAIILVIGVNGVGKTTTVGKLAYQFKNQGNKVILGAADTFRAAATEQLDIWASRAGVDIIKQSQGADPAAVVFDSVRASIARKADILICDTAGRLHNKKNLMQELEKISRVIKKEAPSSSLEVLLVLDASTGQNAISQAKQFKEVANITGIVLTKLDGTAKGGIVIAIKNELEIPVKYIGVGEQVDDLQPFDPKIFADELFSS
ncbi:MAG: signal recognition particle-docking protein FtsY [Oscillospiraceae bacterium]|nr:signal recognition particle-docking protein FtsY [Oscillospiraceae bacterium]